MLTPEDLARAAQEERDAAQTANDKTAARNRLIEQAADEGWTHAQIANAMDLRRGRVGQILMKR